ncbi:MAG: GTPase RsgA, partial [Candidatus Nealsonbacteria bacterium]|nr:GTPase RsgA [Candidatus Nealsonbacteria bacterium]
MTKKKRKIRATFRKNRNVRTRTTDWTRQFDQHAFEDEDPQQHERISGKGELTRKRTVRGAELDAGEEPGFNVLLDVDESVCVAGRVLSVHGLISTVEDADGQLCRCATRRLLKTMSTDQRHVVAAGDRVLFRPVENTDPREGIIERVEPRYGSVCRTSRGRQQVIVSNVDQLLIVSSAAEPRLKPNLIDRLLVTAEKGTVRPVVCI